MEILSMPAAMNTTTTEAEQGTNLTSQIGDLFQNIEHKIRLYSYGKKRTVVDVIYTDFLPVKVVKELIRKMLPSSFSLSIHREYSNHAIKIALYDEFCKNSMRIINCIDGSYETCSIRQFINDKLDEQNLYDETLSNQDLIVTSQN